MTINKYSASVFLTGETAEKIKQIKSELKQILGNYSASNSEPHIVLFDFEADMEKLENFSKKISSVCHGIHPFEVVFKNFEDFYETRTIYVQPDDQSRQNIISLRKQLSAQLKHGRFDQEVNFDAGKDPHITITRMLDEEQYKTATKYFFNKKIAGELLCDRVWLQILVKEKAYSRYEKVRAFEFAKPNLSLF